MICLLACFEVEEENVFIGPFCFKKWPPRMNERYVKT